MVLSLKKLLIEQRTTLLFYSLLVAHFFIALGRDDAFGDLFWQPAYYQDLFFVSVIVFAVSLFILLIWRKLDQAVPWQQKFKKRLLYQSLGGIFLPTLLSALLVYGYMQLILNQPILSTSYLYYELPTSIIIILMINLLLGIHFLIHNKKEIPNPLPAVKESPVVVQSGNSQLLLEPDNIFFVEKEGAICFVYTDSQNKYIYPNSLDQLSQQLQQAFFFRTNRQTITHRKNCLGFETERSGKLILSLHLPASKKITISQRKAREFKVWLKGNI